MLLDGQKQRHTLPYMELLENWNDVNRNSFTHADNRYLILTSLSEIPAHVLVSLYKDART